MLAHGVPFNQRRAQVIFAGGVSASPFDRGCMHCVSTMGSKSQFDDALPSLNAVITALDKARSDATGPKPAVNAFDAASALLTAIRV